MKNQMILAAVLATFAFAPLAQADATAAAPAKAAVVKAAPKTTSTRLTKAEYTACHTQSAALKDGKKPADADVKAAFKDCVKAKKEANAKTKADAPAKTDKK